MAHEAVTKQNGYKLSILIHKIEFSIQDSFYLQIINKMVRLVVALLHVLKGLFFFTILQPINGLSPLNGLLSTKHVIW